jgi:hypothetical protein
MIQTPCFGRFKSMTNESTGVLEFWCAAFSGINPSLRSSLVFVLCYGLLPFLPVQRFNRLLAIHRSSTNHISVGNSGEYLPVAADTNCAIFFRATNSSHPNTGFGILVPGRGLFFGAGFRLSEAPISFERSSRVLYGARVVPTRSGCVRGRSFNNSNLHLQPVRLRLETSRAPKKPSGPRRSKRIATRIICSGPRKHPVIHFLQEPGRPAGSRLGRCGRCRPRWPGRGTACFRWRRVEFAARTIFRRLGIGRGRDYCIH